MHLVMRGVGGGVYREYLMMTRLLEGKGALRAQVGWRCLRENARLLVKPAVQSGAKRSSPITFQPLTLTTQLITFPSRCRRPSLIRDEGSSASNVKAGAKTAINGSTISWSDGSSNPGSGR